MSRAHMACTQVHTQGQRRNVADGNIADPLSDHVKLCLFFQGQQHVMITTTVMVAMVLTR